MHASLRRQVQSEVSGPGSDAHRLPSAQTHESSSQDLPQLSQALVGRHQIGRDGVGAGKAGIEFVASTVAVSAHSAAARSLFGLALGQGVRVALTLDPASHRLRRAIQLTGDALDREALVMRRARMRSAGQRLGAARFPAITRSAWLCRTVHAIKCASLLFRKCRDLRVSIRITSLPSRRMRRIHNLPPSPLAPRRRVRFDLADPEQSHAAAEYLVDKFERLARDQQEYPSEFDRLIAPAEAWSRAVYTDAGLKPDQVVSDDLYRRGSGMHRKFVPSPPRFESFARGSPISSSAWRWSSVS
jgi:hypothetical protein